MIEYDLLGEIEDVEVVEKIIQENGNFKRNPYKPTIYFLVGGDRVGLQEKNKRKISKIPALRVHHRKNSTKSLGFSPDVKLENLTQALYDLVNKEDWKVKEEEMIDCYINSHYRGSAANEVTLQGKDPTSCILFTTLVKGADYEEGLFSPKCNGILVATPHGSTAYSQSLDGPILLSPGQLAIDLINPPTIYRHYVCSIDDKIFIKTFYDAIVTIDKIKKNVKAGTKIKIEKSDETLKFIRTKNTKESLMEKILRKRRYEEKRINTLDSNPH